MQTESGEQTSSFRATEIDVVGRTIQKALRQEKQHMDEAMKELAKRDESAVDETANMISRI